MNGYEKSETLESLRAMQAQILALMSSIQVDILLESRGFASDKVHAVVLHSKSDALDTHMKEYQRLLGKMMNGEN